MNDHWEMRLKNLLWTVSGDYSLEMSFEDDKWEETPWAALYDAVKEGAYVRYCSQTFREEVSLYLLKKIYLGAEEGTLVQAAGLCIDSMAGSRILAERPGAEMIRRRVYEELMDVRFDSLVKSDLGRLSLLWMRASLDGNALAERRLTEHLEHLKTLAKEQGIENREEDTAGEIAKQEEHGENGKAGQSENVRTFLETLDQIYNRLADPAFEKKRGGLDAVLSVTMEELQEFNWQDFLDEEALEQTLEAYRNQLDSRITETEHRNVDCTGFGGGAEEAQGIYCQKFRPFVYDEGRRKASGENPVPGCPCRQRPLLYGRHPAGTAGEELSISVYQAADGSESHLLPAALYDVEKEHRTAGGDIAEGADPPD